MSITHIQFYPSDWLAGTRGLSAEETGVYITLICRMYEMAGPIERDDDRLHRLCGTPSKKTFQKVLGYLIDEGKITEDDGSLCNDRVLSEIEKTTKVSNKARLAAEVRWKRKPNKNNGTNNADASLGHMPAGCQSVVSSQYPVKGKKKVPPKPPKGDDLFEDGFEEFWKAYPSRSLPHNKKTTRAAWDKAIKNKHKPQDIVAGAKRYHRLMEEDDAIGSPYVAMAATYLNQERWADDQTNGSGYDPECGMSYWDWSQKEKANA